MVAALSSVIRGLIAFTVLGGQIIGKENFMR
jgi:hypothetical protein